MIDRKEKIGQLVRLNPRYANIFLKYGIDFCCGGNRSLETAAAESAIDTDSLIDRLTEAETDNSASQAFSFDSMGFEELIDHILEAHHQFIYKESETTLQLLHKVVKVHSENHPELFRVRDITDNIFNELFLHQRKEENILFPYIIAMDNAIKNNNALPDSCFGDIRNPIRAMESDHIETGSILMELKEITNNFTPPENACNSYNTLYARLNNLFNNIIQHIHLENNILHPKAIQRFNHH